MESEHFVSVSGGPLWSVKTGAGIPLLLFNGGPGCDDYLGPVAQLIGDACTVIRFEPRGCGHSIWDGKYDIRPKWPTEQLALLIPRARYIEISGARHYIWLSHAPELALELRRAIEYILNSQAPSTPC